MNGCELIVCERSNRWASALRVAGERDAAAGERGIRLREVRRLDELTAAVAQRRGCFAAIEVHDGNLADVLSWLAMAEENCPRARCAALLDRSLRTDDSLASHRSVPLGEIRTALAEAGASAVADSPRRLSAVLELARRHADVSAENDRAVADELSLTAAIWAALPWQDAR